MNCYKVKVKTTSSLNDTFCITKSGTKETERYFECENGIIYVIGNNLTEIEKLFDEKVILSVERVGIGYYFGR